MLTREKYCAVCGCPFSVPFIRNPENPDPDEDSMLVLNNPYDSRLLPRELTTWLKRFRVVGRWRKSDPLFTSVSSVPDLFISPPANWQYGYTWYPEIPTTEGKEKQISVYAYMDAEDEMLFPIHQACLNLVNRICESRNEQGQAGSTGQPRTLEEFCDCLETRRGTNLDDWREIMKGQGYANHGGIEWSHQYFGARQFWTDEWDTSPGWELLCADPESTKIPGLSSFILSELPQQSNSSQTSTDKQAEVGVEWLFPQELEEIRQLDQGGRDWAEGIKLLQAKANSIEADAGGEVWKGELMASVPLGLQNRWRIWKILELVSGE